MSLSETRRHQLRRARAALAKGNHAEAAAHFFEGIDEFLVRLDRVLAKNDLPPVQPASQRDTRQWEARLEAGRIAREQVARIIARKPELTAPQIAARVGCPEHVIYGVRKQMGIRSPRGARNLRGLYRELLAERPQITNKEAADVLECEESSIRRIRRDLGIDPRTCKKGARPRNY